MKEALEQLYTFPRQLLGSGYDNALEYINQLIGLDVIEVDSGTQLGTWTVPNEWAPKEAWVKYKGKKIIDFAKEPMSLITHSLPFKGTLDLEELKKHIWSVKDKETGDDDGSIPFIFKFYDRDWGFACTQKQFDKLKEGEYEVFIDVEEKPGKMKLGVHTIKGKTDREILLFAHLDHAYMANDNLSGVVCLLEVFKKAKDLEHTVKLVFCPETIGSQAYIYTQDLSRVDFVAAVDICGNDSSVMFQKSWDDEARINRVVHCALQIAGKQYRKGKFRTSIGSDETAFNDPSIGIPGILFTTWPYPEYHTNLDTPEKINYEKISEVADLILKTIEIYEKDYIPVRVFKGPLMRSRYKIQSPVARVNLIWDYLIYSIDGKKTLAEICSDMEMNFEEVYKIFEKIIDDSQMLRTPARQNGQ